MGSNKGLADATNHLVVLVHQDVDLPLGWDSAFHRSAYAGGVKVRSPRSTRHFRAALPRWRARRVPGAARLDREILLDFGSSRGAAADGMDEILLAVWRRNGPRADPQFGFHQYGADLTLTATDAASPRRRRRPRAPTTRCLPTPTTPLRFVTLRTCFGNGRKSVPSSPAWDGWDTMSTPPPLVSVAGTQNSGDEKIADLRRRLDETEQALDAAPSSRTWRIGRTIARMLGRN